MLRNCSTLSGTGASIPKPPQSVKPVWPIQLHRLLSPCGALEQSCKSGMCWEITPARQNTSNPSLWVLEVWAAVQTTLLGSCSKTLPTLLQTKLNQNPHTISLILFVAHLGSPASAKISSWSRQVLRRGFPPLLWAVGLIPGEPALAELLCSCHSPPAQPAVGNNLTSRVCYSGGKNTSHLPGINACLGTKLFSALLSTSPINPCTLISAAHEWVAGSSG